jgi:hypothetical protein
MSFNLRASSSPTACGDRANALSATSEAAWIRHDHGAEGFCIASIKTATAHSSAGPKRMTTAIVCLLGPGLRPAPGLRPPRRIVLNFAEFNSFEEAGKGQLPDQRIGGA